MIHIVPIYTEFNILVSRVQYSLVSLWQHGGRKTGGWSPRKYCETHDPVLYQFLIHQKNIKQILGPRKIFKHSHLIAIFILLFKIPRSSITLIPAKKTNKNIYFFDQFNFNSNLFTAVLIKSSSLGPK